MASERDETKVAPGFQPPRLIKGRWRSDRVTGPISDHRAQADCIRTTWKLYDAEHPDAGLRARLGALADELCNTAGADQEDAFNVGFDCGMCEAGTQIRALLRTEGQPTHPDPVCPHNLWKCTCHPNPMCPHTLECLCEEDE